MAEEIFSYQELACSEIDPTVFYPTGTVKEGPLCSECWRLYFHNHYPIVNKGYITPEYVHNLGLDMVGTAIKVTLHSDNAAQTVERLRLPCSRCLRPATDQAEHIGGNTDAGKLRLP